VVSRAECYKRRDESGVGTTQTLTPLPRVFESAVTSPEIESFDDNARGRSLYVTDPDS